MDKCIIPKKKREPARRGGIIRVDTDLYDQLCELSDETRQPIGCLVRMLVEYAMAHIAIVDE